MTATLPEVITRQADPGNRPNRSLIGPLPSAPARKEGDLSQCPNFNAGITARLAGQSLSRSHQQLHSQRLHEVTDSF
jgi:hypothetical protein